MKRIALVLVAMLVFGGMILSAQTTVLKVKVQTANVRSQPDTGAAVIKQVKLGTLLESKQKVGDWYEISVTNELGVSLTAYIHVNVVDVVTGGAVPTPEETRPVAPPVAVGPAAPGGSPGPRHELCSRGRECRRHQAHGRFRQLEPCLFR